MVDNFDLFVRLYPLKKTTTVATINQLINDFISKYGKPIKVVSDHGVQFTSNIWRSRLQELGIPPTLTSVYHPQSNPVERVMRELGRMFHTYCSTMYFQWVKYVSYVEWVFNNTVHETT